MKKNTKGLILSILGILGLIAITTGVTYAFFNYIKQGTTENSITTGTITFLYTEVSEVGRGISINNAYPVSDEQGKVQTGEGKVFDFKVTNNTMNETSISYEITARKKTTENILDEEAIKLYLTKVSGNSEEEVLLDNYSNLTQTTKVDSNKYTEKTLHTDKVPANSTNYEQTYRLRMWIDEDIDFSPVKNEVGNDTYSYNNKTFTVTVNVYANAKIVTEEEIALENNTSISSLTVDGTELTKVEEQDYDYAISLQDGTTSATINVETTNPKATVEIETNNTLSYNTNIKRLSTTKTLELIPGDNYFKITVTSENKKNNEQYQIRIRVPETITIFGKKISVILDTPTLTTSSNNTSDANGLYKSLATNNGKSTYYFRGEVEDNYLDFAGFTWRIVRINEDGTIRIILQDGINNNATYMFNANDTDKIHMYYSTSDEEGAKYYLDTWYNDNIVTKGYSDDVATGDYYCEQARTAIDNAFGIGSGANMTIFSNYSPTFKCSTDNNGYGIVNSNIGLLTYDEVIYAGGHRNNQNDKFYLYNSSIIWWLMSTAGFHTCSANWTFGNYISFTNSTASTISHPYQLRPVINLKSDVTATGTGTSDDHWVVQ